MAANWKCSQRGDCCRTLGYITMTEDEAAILRERWRDARGPLTFVPADGGFTTLVGTPCPFYVNDSCTVYDARPYNCRRFMCFRDQDAEPFDTARIAAKVIHVRDLRRQYDRNQQKAQKWATAHGWGE